MFIRVCGGQNRSEGAIYRLEHEKRFRSKREAPKSLILKCSFRSCLKNRHFEILFKINDLRLFLNPNSMFQPGTRPNYIRVQIPEKRKTKNRPCLYVFAKAQTLPRQLGLTDMLLGQHITFAAPMQTTAPGTFIAWRQPANSVSNPTKLKSAAKI